jgi:hypothetical protein
MQTLALALAGAAPFAAFVEPITKRADLDGDPRLEVVRVRPHPPRGAEDTFRRTQVRVSDFCPGRQSDERIGAIHDNLERIRLRPLDRRDGREIFYVMRDGARGALGAARVVAWRLSSGPNCRRPKDLFRYSSLRPTRAPRGSNGDTALFNARLRDAAPGRRGLELVLTEHFQRAGDPPFFGSLKKTSYWSYRPTRDRFVRYRTIVTTLRAPGTPRGSS